MNCRKHCILINNVFTYPLAPLPCFPSLVYVTDLPVHATNIDNINYDPVCAVILSPLSGALVALSPWIEVESPSSSGNVIILLVGLLICFSPSLHKIEHCPKPFQFGAS